MQGADEKIPTLYLLCKLVLPSVKKVNTRIEIMGSIKASNIILLDCYAIINCSLLPLLIWMPEGLYILNLVA